jgi:hypothetical protein
MQGTIKERPFELITTAVVFRPVSRPGQSCRKGGMFIDRSDSKNFKKEALHEKTDDSTGSRFAALIGGGFCFGAGV